MTPIWFTRSADGRGTDAWKQGWLVDVLSADYAIVAYDDLPARADYPKGSLRLATTRIEYIRIRRTPAPPLFEPQALPQRSDGGSQKQEENQHERDDQPTIPASAWGSIGKWK